MIKKLFLLTCFVSSFSLCAQVNVLWQNRYTSSGNNSDRAEDLVIDSKGNVYVTGTGYGTSGTFDYVTIKYDSTGTQLWKKEYNGPADGLDQAHAITIDTGFVYVTGISYGGGSTGFDYATLKYNIHTGATVWASASRYTGAVSGGTDEAYDIAVDNNANVYITGTSATTLTNNSAATTIKYNASGVQQWVDRYEGSGAGIDAAFAIAVEPIAGTLYVTGYAYIAGAPAADFNYLTIKYNTSSNNRVWTSLYNGPDNKYDEARSIAIDALGNVYITGYSQNAVVTNYDIATVKYNTSGVQQWVKRYNGTGNDYDKGNALKLDVSGNVYVTGRSVGISPAAEDIITIKYTNAGVEKWSARYDNGGVNPYDEGKALALDVKGNVYVTGYSSMGTNKNNYTTLKYDSLGVQKWVAHYNGTGNNSDQAVAIAVDNKDNVFITGLSGGAGSSEDYETIKYCQLTANAGTDTTICVGTSVMLYASALGGVSYSWLPNDGTLTNTSIANPIATPTVTTSYIVSVTNASGCVDVDTILITVNPKPSTIITSSGSTTFCAGDSVTLTAALADFYQWSSSLNDTLQSITVHTSGTYTVVLTNTTGCTSTASVITTMNPIPVIYAGPDDTICMNSNINLLATGGNSYTWQPAASLNNSTLANPVATPLTTTTYTVLAMDANGCSDSDSVKITVRSLPPVPTITQGPGYTLVCTGSHTTYQWYYNGSLISGATNSTYVYNQNGNYTVVVTDSPGGCSVSSAVLTVSNYIGIDELGNRALLNVYPNPASTCVFIDLEIFVSSDLQIVFSSMTGQLLYKEQLKQYIGDYKKNIDLAAQAAGIYYLQIVVGDKTIVKKVVKQ